MSYCLCGLLPFRQVNSTRCECNMFPCLIFSVLMYLLVCHCGDRLTRNYCVSLCPTQPFHFFLCRRQCPKSMLCGSLWWGVLCFCRYSFYSSFSPRTWSILFSLPTFSFLALLRSGNSNCSLKSFSTDVNT